VISFERLRGTTAVDQQNGPPDKPIAANSTQQLQKIEKAIEPYVKKAKETLPEAQRR
jgi:hypothetical protein